MKQVLRFLVGLSRLATGLAFLTLIVAVLWQVIGRSIIQDSPVWTEELTRFALLYLAAFGAGLSLRSGDLVNVDIISEATPPPWPKWLRVIAACATLVLCAFLVVPAMKYTSIGAFQTSPALSWRMDFIHASVLIMILSLLFFAAARAIEVLLGQSEDYAFDGDAERDETEEPSP